MKKRSILICLSTIMCSTISSAAIYAFNVNNTKIIHPVVNFSSTQLYNSSETENKVMFSNNNYSESKKVNKFIPVKNGFNDLSDYNERLLYNKIESGCGNILNQNHSQKSKEYPIAPMIVNCRLEEDKIKKVIYAIRNDHPEYFWLSSKYTICYAQNNSTVLKLKSTMSLNEKIKAEETLNNKVEEIMAKIPINTNDYEKELFLHNYIVNNSTYKIIPNDQTIFTPYGCLVNKVSVCEGNATAMQMLLSRCGIESRVIVGEKEKEQHMWNLVKIQGRWYHLDVTWDNTLGDLHQYDYFNVDDDTIKLDHKIHEKLGEKPWPKDKRYNFSLPECNSKIHNFYQRNAVRVSNLKTVHDIVHHISILNALKKKEYFYIRADSKKELQTFTNRLFNGDLNIFTCISNLNKNISSEFRIDSKRIYYDMHNNHNVLVIKLKYKQ